MNIEKIAEERYPEKACHKFKYPSDYFAYEHDTMVSRKAFISGYQLASQRTEELEREIAEFTEWVGANYVKLHKVWVHRYASQTNPENFLTYAQLREVFKRHQKTMTDFLNSDR